MSADRKAAGGQDRLPGRNRGLADVGLAVEEVHDAAVGVGASLALTVAVRMTWSPKVNALAIAPLALVTPRVVVVAAST